MTALHTLITPKDLYNNDFQLLGPPRQAWPQVALVGTMLRMQFRFSWKVTLTTGMLALGMVYASVWQWDRHLQKQSLIEHLQETLTLPPIPLIDLLRVPPSWESLTFRRIQVSGSYDFQHETLLRNNWNQEPFMRFQYCLMTYLSRTHEKVTIGIVNFSFLAQI